MARTRRIMKGQGYLSRGVYRCRLCGGLLCRGEGRRLMGWGTLCFPCHALVLRGRAKGWQDAASYALRDAQRLLRVGCEREGRCQLRHPSP